jgi:hypothetical protein
MRSLADDIKITLFVKLILLAGLWFFFVKGAPKQSLNVQHWLLGSKNATTAMLSPKIHDLK